MTKFNTYKATHELRKLARFPYDCTKEGAISEKRIEDFSIVSHGLKLLYATERVDENIIEALIALAKEAKAVDKMHQMQNGEIINCIEGYESENRPVLHTAMRDFFYDRKELPEVAKKLSEKAYLEHKKLRSFLDEIEQQGFTDIIQIGIGGSELGPKAIYLALEAFKRKDRRVHFISNIDPDETKSVLDLLDLSKTLVVVVSKSGVTLETRTNEAFVKSRFLEEGLSPEKHFLAVTGEKSPMDNPDHYFRSFYMWDSVGGRYSATSMVGCVVLAFALGLEKVMQFLRGASSMDQVALESDPKKNLPLFSALLGIWNHNFLHLPTRAVIPYSKALSRLPAHLQQCDMESNGKRIDKLGNVVDFSTGPIVWGEPGTNGQHSFYQLIHQGTITVPIEFIGFKESQCHVDQDFEGTTSQEKLLSNLFAQSIGLASGQENTNPNKVFPGNRPNRVLLAKQCTPYTVGALLSYFEHQIAFQGFIWDINSFDQEGVQLGKILANKIIDLFNKDIELDKKRDFPLGRLFIDQLRDL
ncbi:glucose-6-phosphate isomerase [Candidatus Aerophobetes bacterium]|uniref:Glucose-6-phosphate isomerase n=1 Tax=Aerophobetes bacterium TaxID=2030807 RepID=A0A2A4WZK5_UNCAE|nr:MAG: glucose-6-phosphate isomerase [Candidatus Aerophobetes bacterium]